MLTPDQLIDSYHGRGELLARCILAGLAEPSGEMNPDILFNVMECIVEEVQSLRKDDFRRRFPRALKWAVRPDVADMSPEFSIVTIQKALMSRSPTQQREMRKTPEYKAYREKFAPVLDELGFA